MPEPKTYHFWLPNGRTLCDRRAESDPSELGGKHPACGSCMLISHLIRSTMVAANRHGGSVYPETGPEALAAMKNTAWQRVDELWAASDRIENLDLNLLAEASFPDSEIKHIEAERRDADQNNQRVEP